MRLTLLVPLVVGACMVACSHAVDFTQLLAEARSSEVFDFVIGVRRALHAAPELSYQEHNTSAFIRQKLDELGIPYDYPIAETGISAVIGV